MVRRVRLLLPVLEEVRDSKMLLPPSAVGAFHELHSIMLKATTLVDEFKSSSQLWLLAQCEDLSARIFEICRDMAAPLFALPLNLLELPIELKEQVELLKLQAKRSKLFLDPAEDKLHKELMSMLDDFHRKKNPSSDRIEALFKALMLNTSKDCQRELQQLQKQLQAAAAVEEIRSPPGNLRRVASSKSASSSLSTNRSSNSSSKTSTRITSLINFLCYSSCVLYGMIAEATNPAGQQQNSSEDDDDDEDVGGEDEASDVEEQIVSSSTMMSNTPDEYKCPISLELMKDPVIIATGQTYDRTSIQRWVEAGNLTCPKSGQKLIHMTLIPNFAVRSLIAQWCEKNRIPFTMMPGGKDLKTGGMDHIANAQATIEAAKMTASFLVGKLAMGSPEIQKQAAYELRLLAKSGMENRKCIAEAGAIPFLVSLLHSRDATTQENAITALLNLSIFDNNKMLIMTAGALDPIITVLASGHTTEARENAAALVELLRNGTQTGKKDAVSALFNLSLLTTNREKVVETGAVTILIEILQQQVGDQTENPNAELLESSLALLGLLAAYEPGAKSIVKACARTKTKQ